jgi:hypothetical protein
MDRQLEFLKYIVDRLDMARIPYMLTGSMAMAAYKEPRETTDIDIVIEAREDDARKIFKVFKGECFVDYERMLRALVERNSFNIVHNDWFLKAVFLVRKDEAYWEVEFERRTRIDYQGIPLFIVSREDLILCKLYCAWSTGVESHVEDARMLVESADGLDWPYLNTWGNLLDVSEQLRGIENTG